jgi:hypothetical protein
METMKSKLILSFVCLAVSALAAKDESRTTIQVVASSTGTVAPGWTKTTTSDGGPRQIPQVNIKAILSDGRRLILSCQKTFVWSRCKQLDTGSYSAEVKGNSVLVYTHDLSGKEQHAIPYSYVGEWEPDSQPPASPQK